MRHEGHIRFVKEQELGEAREYLLLPQKGRFKGLSQKTNEIFFSVKMQNGQRSAGFIHRNDTLDEFTRSLIQDRYWNQHIQFIEWDHLINCVIEDGIYISSVWFAMTKEEFDKFLSRIIPTDWSQKYDDNR